MTSGGGVKHTQNQEPRQIFDRNKHLDRIKDDGVRKELYENERKARDKWEEKWGFLKNPRRLWEEEIAKRGLRPGILDRNHVRDPPPWPEDRIPKVDLLPSEGVPILSSGMIGWRTFSNENNLDWMTGPMYVSKRTTMNPPLGPDDPDPRYQRVIFLG